jgi:hypothetical protein
MAAKWGGLPFLRHKGGQEWSAACPRCGAQDHDPASGDPDRFHIHAADAVANARGICRKCGFLEWLDDPEPRSPERVQAEARIRQEMAEKQRAYMEDRLRWLQGAQFWRQFHTAMTPEQRALWHAEGIADWAIDFHMLGYSPGRDDLKPALTIPYLDADRAIQTLQFRVVGAEGSDKYRFIRDLDTTWFMPWPKHELSGVVLILEGAKKALVTYDRVGDHLRYRGKEVSIVASPSKGPREAMIKALKEAELLLWLMDPDAYNPVAVNGKRLPPPIERNLDIAGHDRSLVVRLPAKIDDMFLAGYLTPAALQAAVSQAEVYVKTNRRRTARV